MATDKKRNRPRGRQTRAQQFFMDLTVQVVPHAEAMILHLDDPESRRFYQQEKEILVEWMTYGWILAASMTEEQHRSYHEAWRERLESTSNQLDFSSMVKKQDLLTNFEDKMREYLLKQLFMDDLIAFAQGWFINIVSMDGSWKYVADMLEKHGYEWQDFRTPSDSRPSQ
jgi:hypothetical protein